MEQSSPRYTFVRINPLCAGFAEYVVADTKTASIVFGTRTQDAHRAQRTADSLNKAWAQFLALRDGIVKHATGLHQGLIP